MSTSTTTPPEPAGHHPPVTELPSPPAGSSGTPYRWRWIVLATVLIAEIMDLVDATIVNIAAPSIRAELGGSESAMQWMLAGYTLAFAIGLISFGRLGDLVGRRRLFVIGAVGFTVASAICGLSTSPELLIGSRVAQGLLGAVMIPQGFAILKAVFPADEIGKAFAMFGPVMGLSAVAGPIMAGVLIDANWFDAGWRMIFFINVPIGIAALVGALRFMPEVKTPGASRLDAAGVILVSLASGLLIYPLVQGRELGWPLWTILMMIASVPTFALFGWRERRSGNPVIDPSLFRSRGYVAGLGGDHHLLPGDVRLHAGLQPVHPARPALQPAEGRPRDGAVLARDRDRRAAVRRPARAEARAEGAAAGHRGDDAGDGRCLVHPAHVRRRDDDLEPGPGDPGHRDRRRAWCSRRCSTSSWPRSTTRPRARRPAY